MTYELLPSGRGVMIDRAPILSDVRDTFRVSFLLPGKGAYLALFTDADGVEHKKAIADGRCKLPKELLKKEQYVSLTVSETDGERVLRSWECEPLKITAFLYMRQSQWQVSGGMTDKDAYERMVELERLYAWSLKDFAALDCTFNDYRRQTDERLDNAQITLDTQSKTIAGLQTENDRLSAAYNEAAKIVAKVDDRLKALEDKYDPLG